MDFDAICIVGFLVLGIYKLFELFVRKNERLALIEKLTVLNTDLPVKLPPIVFENKTFGSGSLKIALLLIGIGFGCVLGGILQYLLYNYEMVLRGDASFYFRQIVSVMYVACIALFGGAGLLIAFFIERKELNQSKE
ncbi:MAG: hypothetical protein LBR66_05480 [Candidatus Symbiothrix sp.]|jgi:hypothetical protein|nr:hypothetical protein [Candidatus Symbiothrix sp.]